MANETASHETIETTETRVACDGGGGALGHPKVYYDLGHDGKAECNYCGRVFVRKGDASGAH